jgi:ABC-type dipeptide/oligopeptide/nickel transport system permease subunit
MSALRSRRLLAGACIVMFFVGVAVIGPFFAADPNAFSRAEWQSPSAAHWLGTTQLGQDVLAQLVTGTGAEIEPLYRLSIQRVVPATPRRTTALS